MKSNEVRKKWIIQTERNTLDVREITSIPVENKSLETFSEEQKQNIQCDKETIHSYEGRTFF